MSVKGQNPYVNTPSASRVVTCDKDEAEAVATLINQLLAGTKDLTLQSVAFNGGAVASVATASTHKMQVYIGGLPYYFLLVQDGGG